MDDISYGIGQFSTLTRLSVRMLRHYDEHGVLVPAWVDPVTGYRRYAPDQVADAAAVCDLRDAGFGVSSIAGLLQVRGTPEFRTALDLRREAVLGEIRAAHRRLELIDRLLQTRTAPMPTIDITERIEPAQTLVALRGIVPTYADEPLLWNRFLPELRRQGLTPLDDTCGCIEYDDEYKEADVDEAVWVPVAPGRTVSAPLERIELPERRIAVATLRGPYDQLTAANQQLGAYVAEHGLRMADHGYNRYFNTPDVTPRDELVTEVCWPVA